MKKTHEVCEVKPGISGVPEVTPTQTRDCADKVHVIDVRRPDEFTGELGHIAGARLSTLEGSFMKDITTWPKDESYIFVCRSGGRSGQATGMALSMGFKKVYNMAGGMIAWNADKLPTER